MKCLIVTNVHIFTFCNLKIIYFCWKDCHYKLMVHPITLQSNWLMNISYNVTVSYYNLKFRNTSYTFFLVMMSTKSNGTLWLSRLPKIVSNRVSVISFLDYCRINIWISVRKNFYNLSMYTILYIIQKYTIFINLLIFISCIQII